MTEPTDGLSQPIKIAVAGAAGKMGCSILRVLAETPDVVLVAALENAHHHAQGKDSGELSGLAANHLPLTASLDSALALANVIIDFTQPSFSAELAAHAASKQVGLVIGTTGLDNPQKHAIEQAAKHVPIVFSPNMSVGINVAMRLLAMAVRALGDDFDIEIVETHHRMKKDSPSGTALRLAEVIAEALGRNPAETFSFGRKGNVGARKPGEIGILAMRGGDVVGDHTVHFLGLGERLEITHRASSRETLARGAVRAALWLRERDPGLYSMQDVLGL